MLPGECQPIFVVCNFPQAARLINMKKIKKEKIDINSDRTDNQNIEGYILNEEPQDSESIQDFIERKRLQNRILEKLINQIKSPDKSK